MTLQHSFKISCLVLLTTIIGCMNNYNSEWYEKEHYRWRPINVGWFGNTGFSAQSLEILGITFSNELTKELITQNRVFLNGSGVAIGDINGDGLSDLYFARLDGKNALYKNLGDWQFQDITAQSGVACDNQFSTGTVLVDIDGDKDLDLLVSSIGGPNALLINDGYGVFEDRTLEAGFSFESGGATMALADIEGDGDLDVYVSNYKKLGAKDIWDAGELLFEFVVDKSGATPRIAEEYQEHFVLEIREDRLLFLEVGEKDILLINEGNGIFNKASFFNGRFKTKNGIMEKDLKDWGLLVRFQDFDNDGDPDIYVCNDFESPDRLWINDGAGNFSSSPNFFVRNTSNASMAVDFSDVDRDGKLDFLVVDMLSQSHKRRMTQRTTEVMLGFPIGLYKNQPQYMKNTLFLNRGDNTYSEIAQFSGIQASDWSWSNLFLDVDFDGYEDMLVATGHYYDAQDQDAMINSYSRIQMSAIKKRMADAGMGSDDENDKLNTIFLFPSLKLSNVAFRNLGNLRFEDKSSEWGFTSVDISHGMALGDLDNDGDLDVVMNRLNDPAAIYRNDSNAPRIAVRLRGDSPNTQGIGSKVKLLGGPVDQMKEVISGGSYLSGSDPLVSFAAWDEKREFTLEVTWRSGEVSRIEGVKGNRLYEVYESSSKPAPPPVLVESSPMFEDVSHLIDHSHHEDPYDDFARQSLLPSRLSQLGPGVAWGDVDSDGDDDLVLPSGRGGRLSVFINTGGTFSEIKSSVVGHDQTGVVIYPSSSGPEILVGHSNFESTVEETSFIQGYRVEGNRIVETRRIRTNLSSVGALCMADIDGDGDLDLFAGGRTVPGRYPEPASSMLFINDSGPFVPDSENNANLKEIGLITGALFSDIDSDNDPDLILAVEWGPVTILENRGGTFSDATASFGLSDYVGWWNGVTTGDFNEDGRLDIVATNWGLNTKYHATEKHPTKIYYSDFDKDGHLDLLESRFDVKSDRLVAMRALTPMLKAIPMIRSNAPNNDRYSKTSLDKVLGPPFTKSNEKNANTLSHMLFLNRGSSFDGKLLPDEAQFAPGFHAGVSDYDGDGHEDLFLSQNFFAYHVGTPRSDGGRGLWLRGDGTGVLTPVAGQETGIKVYGEQRGAAVADFDGDGRIDLVVSQNGAETKLYRNVGGKPGLSLKDVTTGQVRVKYRDGSYGPLREIRVGSGYWSQGNANILGLKEKSQDIELYWKETKVKP